MELLYADGTLEYKPRIAVTESSRSISSGVFIGGTVHVVTANALTRCWRLHSVDKLFLGIDERDRYSKHTTAQSAASMLEALVERQHGSTLSLCASGMPERREDPFLFAHREGDSVLYDVIGEAHGRRKRDMRVCPPHYRDEQVLSASHQLHLERLRDSQEHDGRWPMCVIAPRSSMDRCLEWAADRGVRTAIAASSPSNFKTLGKRPQSWEEADRKMRSGAYDIIIVGQGFRRGYDIDNISTMTLLTHPDGKQDMWNMLGRLFRRGGNRDYDPIVVTRESGAFDALYDEYLEALDNIQLKERPGKNVIPIRPAPTEGERSTNEEQVTQPHPDQQRVLPYVADKERAHQPGNKVLASNAHKHIREWYESKPSRVELLQKALAELSIIERSPLNGMLDHACNIELKGLVGADRESRAKEPPAAYSVATRVCSKEFLERHRRRFNA